MPSLLETTLVIFAVLVLLYIGYVIGALVAQFKWKQKLPREREEAIKKSRAVLSGQFSEQLAPFLPNFPYKPTETRFLGKPVDFIVFKGLDEKNTEKIIFVEVKSGTADLSTSERRLRDAIKKKKVVWEEYRIPEEVTK